MPSLFRTHHQSQYFSILSSFVALIQTSFGALIVDPPKEITHKVVVQPIVVESSDGDISIFMGTGESELYMKEQINRVWAQLGIEIEWLEPVSYVNDFAYDGYPSDYTNVARPQSHLGTILTDAGTPPRHPNGAVLNLFFVDICPGFRYIGDYSAAGLAIQDRNGSTIVVGQGLVTWEQGRDAAASVIAHEIGHNLGLSHYASDSQNLLFSGSRSASKLYAEQLTTILNDAPSQVDGYDFLQSLSPETNYSQWASLNNLVEDSSGDDDDDNLSNAFEFLCGTSPKVFNALPAPSPTASGFVWSLTKNPAAIADGFGYSVIGSTDLSQWIPADESGSPATTFMETDTNLQVLLSSITPSAFLRFGVIIPPEIAAASATFIPLDLVDQSIRNAPECCGDECHAVTLVHE